MHVPLWGWLAFLVLVLGCFVVDLTLGHRGDRPVALREAALWSAVWAGVGLAFTGVIAGIGGGESAGEYLAGFFLEKSLSVDNIFVFALLFTYFAVPREAQHRALLYGVLGALVLRGVFIAVGASLLHAFHWSVWLLGGVLIATAIRMLTSGGEEVHPERNPVLRLLRRIVPMSTTYEGARLWSGRTATPLLGVLVSVATTDVLFAVDSVPAVFAVTTDTFVVFAANAFSVLGLRPLYFLLAGAMERFGRLKYGLAAVLVFVGAKMLLTDVVHISVWLSLLVIFALLTAAILASLHAGSAGAGAVHLAGTGPSPLERTGAAMSAPTTAPPSPPDATPRPGPLPPDPAAPRDRLTLRFHPSVLLAVALIAVLLGGSVLPGLVPGRSGAAYALAAVGGAVLFLGSVVLHELAHALLARRNGVRVKTVTLWALGGSTELDGEPAGPGAQFRIAGAGPLASLLVGAGLIALALPFSGLLAGVLAWIGVTNVVLAAFNLLPGAPLDGGRLVAAAVWKRTGSRTRGTGAAATAGRYVGLLVLALGVFQAVARSLPAGLWLMVIGWFLLGTARLEGTRARTTEGLAGRTVASVMRPASAAPGWLTVEAFLDRVVVPSRETVFALSAFDGSPAGIVTLAQLTAVPVERRPATRTQAVATPAGAVPTLAPADPAADLAPRMGAGAVLVVADGLVVGLVTAEDLARALALGAAGGGAAGPASEELIRRTGQPAEPDPSRDQLPPPTEPSTSPQHGKESA